MRNAKVLKIKPGDILHVRLDSNLTEQATGNHSEYLRQIKEEMVAELGFDFLMIVTPYGIDLTKKPGHVVHPEYKKEVLTNGDRVLEAVPGDAQSSSKLAAGDSTDS